MVLPTKAINKEQDNFPFLGFFGIFKESIKLILTWPKIFMQITLVSIFPRSCIFFLVSNWFSIRHNSGMSTIGHNQVSSPWYSDILGSAPKEWFTSYSLMNMVYYIFSIISSMVSISAVVYTIACIYTNQEITFKKVMSVVPKVWKPFMITYICTFSVTFAYSFIPLMSAILISFIFNDKLGKVVLFIGILLVVVGIFYTSTIWQLANVISVKEENCGIKALQKSRVLIKGKMGTALAIWLVPILCELPILALKTYEQIVGDGIGVGEELSFKILSMVWLSVVNLLVLVIQAVFYFVCKSYHHEDIDKFTLSDHFGYYAPLIVEIV